MKVALQPGDKLEIVLDNTDGSFEVHYDTKEHPNSLIIKETAGLPGSVMGAANKIMYHEQWNDGPPGDVAVEELGSSRVDRDSQPIDLLIERMETDLERSICTVLDTHEIEQYMLPRETEHTFVARMKREQPDLFFLFYNSESKVAVSYHQNIEVQMDKLDERFRIILWLANLRARMPKHSDRVRAKVKEICKQYGVDDQEHIHVFRRDPELKYLRLCKAELQDVIGA